MQYWPHALSATAVYLQQMARMFYVDSSKPHRCHDRTRRSLAADLITHPVLQVVTTVRESDGVFCYLRERDRPDAATHLLYKQFEIPQLVSPQ
jgi:hypothetical protein